MRKTSWKTGADDGAERKSGATFRTIFRCGGLSGATIRTTQLPLFPTTCRGLFQKTDAESVAKLATFSLCRSQWIGKIAVLSRAAKILHRLHELHYLRRSQKYVSIAHAAAMGIRVPLSQALFSVAEVSKQGICPDKCRKAAHGTHSFTPSFLL